MNLRKSEITYTLTDSSAGVNAINELCGDIKVLFFDLARRDVSVEGCGNDGEKPVVMYGDDEKVTQLTIDLPGYEIISASITKYTLKVCLYKSESSVDRLLNIQFEMTARAMDILAQEHEIRPIDGFDFLHVKSIDDTDIEFEGTERWAYGGSETYYHTMPVNVLRNDEFLANYLQGIRDHVADKNRRDAIANQKQKDAERAADLKKIEELKAKHGIA